MITADAHGFFSGPSRVRAAGKYLRDEQGKWFLNGVSYGPFRPNTRGEPFPEDEVLRQDFARIRGMGFNTVRIYHLPSNRLIAEAEAAGLRLLAGIPWTDHVDFLSDKCRRAEIERQVMAAAAWLGTQLVVAAILVGNEIEKTLVRWMGPDEVLRFLERLVDLAKEAAPRCLISYATYPSTEYLVPGNADFLAVNVYLEERTAFERYLRRLHHVAGNRPVVITEFGVDALSRGEQAQAEIRRWQNEAVRSLAAAGNVWFAYTDEWFRGGAEVTGWAFGLVSRGRAARPASQVTEAEFPRRDTPMISVVVCTFNGSATLRECLESLRRQSYASHEVIVVDDGSTDTVAEIAHSFAEVRYARQQHAGLSAARNLGARMARGAIVAYTDDDCMADEDWLTRLAPAFDDPFCAAAGGPNISPHPRNRVERVVAASPGGPSHVLLDDENAEHLPGCNLAIRKSALESLGGFNDLFRVAGDDVDICWRLREGGGCLRFVPGAMVWHHRRFSVASYLRQQAGYGYAEALLMKQHPQRFGLLGGARWRGMIYGFAGQSLLLREGAVFHGPFGTGLFQAIYASSHASRPFDRFAGVAWLVALLAAGIFGSPVLASALLLLACYEAWRRMSSQKLSATADKGLLWLLTLVQPVVRDLARIHGMIRLGAHPVIRSSRPGAAPPAKLRKHSRRALDLVFWSEAGPGRQEWMQAFRAVLAEEHLQAVEDDGWSWCDFEVFGLAGINCITEYHAGGGRLTRVRICRRVVRAGPGVLASCVCVLGFVWFGFVPALLGRLRLGPPPPALFLVTLLAPLLFSRFFIWSTARSKVREMALRAAQKAGLQWVQDSDQAAGSLPCAYPFPASRQPAGGNQASASW